MGQKQSIFDTIVDINMKSKHLARLSKKASEEIEREKLKVKRAIQKGDVDSARIFAENAIRKEHDSLSYLQLSSRLDALSSRLNAAYQSQEMTKDIARAIPSFQKSLNSLKIDDLQRSLVRFEDIFTHVDTASSCVTEALEKQKITTTPQSKVDALINKVAEEHALDIGDKFKNLVPLATEIATEEKPQSIMDRLNKL